MDQPERDTELIAAYHAGRLTVSEIECLEARMLQDPAFARDVESLAPVASWLAQSFAAAPSAHFRLSPESASAVRAAANGHIVEFPSGPAAPARTRMGAAHALRRYGLAAAAAVAMIVGGISGFESGRVQYSESPEPLLIAIDASESDSAVSESEAIHFYPPAYGLDHADLRALTSRSSQSFTGTAYATPAVQPHRDYGLPGPGSSYLRSRELLFLQ